MLILFVYQKEQTTATSLATLPASFQTLAPQATEYCLACVALPPDVSVGKGLFIEFEGGEKQSG